MHRPVAVYDPFQARAMDKSDIREFRRWHRDAALRAKRAGFDLVYVYAGHDLTMPMHFLCRRYNQRRDEYGGSLENRVRLLRELLEDTKEAVGDTCAVPLRMAVDELRGEDGLTAEGEGREIVEMLAELPDLWDVNVSNWPNDSLTSRFGAEGFQETYVNFVKQVTSKPVVGVGRFTSPDAMVSQIKRGARRGLRSPTPFSRRRSRRAARRTSASASAATSVRAAREPTCPCAAPKTRPWARNGARAGIRR
jgi:dimethylamine/trimethylamine dehydrogenase